MPVTSHEPDVETSVQPEKALLAHADLVRRSHDTFARNLSALDTKDSVSRIEYTDDGLGFHCSGPRFSRVTVTALIGPDEEKYLFESNVSAEQEGQRANSIYTLTELNYQLERQILRAQSLLEVRLRPSFASEVYGPPRENVSPAERSFPERAEILQILRDFREQGRPLVVHDRSETYADVHDILYRLSGQLNGFGSPEARAPLEQKDFNAFVWVALAGMELEIDRKNAPGAVAYFTVLRETATAKLAKDFVTEEFVANLEMAGARLTAKMAAAIPADQSEPIIKSGYERENWFSALLKHDREANPQTYGFKNLTVHHFDQLIRDLKVQAIPSAVGMEDVTGSQFV